MSLTATSTTTPPSTTITHLYKILPTPPPAPLPSTLPLSPLDTSSGFIHLSTASQVPRTADRFFAVAAELWVLKIRIQDLEGEGKGEVRWEEVDGELFPHLYGGGLGRGNVREVVRVQRDGGKWADGEVGRLEN